MRMEQLSLKFDTPAARTFRAVSRSIKSLLILLLLASCSAGERSETEKSTRPNLIMILTDDQRWDSIGGRYGGIIQTPELDSLAREGVHFRNAFCTTSICASSRASVLSGLYTRSHGIDTFDQAFSDSAFARTYPALLREAGYYTGFIGKWGLGGELPVSRFDSFQGFSGQGRYFPEGDESGEHLTTRIAADAVRFLEASSDRQPFCLSVSFKAPHVQDEDPRQFIYDPAYESLYQEESVAVPETARPRYFELLPPFIQDSEGRSRWERRFAGPEQYQNSVKAYYRLISGVDAAVARMRRSLREQNLEENTVLLFTSDNGFFLSEHGLAGKWLMYEESIRIPLLLYMPGLEPEQRGRSVEEMVLNIDVAPTLLGLAGVPAPPSMQGSSLLPLLRPEASDWRQDWFYEHPFEYGGRIPPSEGVRTAAWKYVRYLGRDPVHEQLFDLSADPGEVENLAGVPEQSQRLDRLRERWRSWRERLDAWSPETPWSDPAGEEIR